MFCTKSLYFYFKLLKVDERKSHQHLGLYIYGNVGTGKTMMMDLFYHCVNVSQKKECTIIHSCWMFIQVLKYNTSHNQVTLYNIKLGSNKK